jgi:SSS family solute:Na+ symporter
LDIYKKAINTKASEKNMVNTGKVAVVVAMILGVILSFVIGDMLMGEGKQGFQYIQEYTGFVSPGIFAMFILGFFWKKATSNAALFATIGGLGFAIVFKFLPYWTNLSFLSPFGFSKLNADNVYEIPFLDRMGFVFVICIVGMYIISMIDNARGVRTHGLEVDVNMFKTNRGFAIGAIVVAVILTFLYTVFW